MARRKIEVDEDVFEVLQREAVPFEDTEPNDVLRRLLLGHVPTLRGEKAGDLMPLLESGLLKAGDKLEHHRPRKGRTFTAEVTADGHIQLPDERRFAAPSPALKACVGSDINGWANWKVVRTGQLLQEVRGH
jgi:hypothetical protein